MYKYVVLCLCVSLSGALCDLNKEEGSACEWDGVAGKCVKKTQCLTTLDTRGDPHPVCSTKGDVTIVCCTDCELFNNTRNVELTYYRKDGNRARDSCLEYLDTLPYKCREGGFHSRISKKYDEAKKCHTIGLWGIGSEPSPDHEPGIEYPHQALVGYKVDLAGPSIRWRYGGTIISNKYILTIGDFDGKEDFIRFIALGVKNLSDYPAFWQTHWVKRLIVHPDYSGSNNNAIALIETEKTIIFNKNVLPACLHVEAAADETAISTAWKHSEDGIPDAIQTIKLQKLSDDKCKSEFRISKNYIDGVNQITQVCYSRKSGSDDVCEGISGAPLLIKTQFSRCIYTVIAVALEFRACTRDQENIYRLFIRVAPYKSWIESVVWA